MTKIAPRIGILAGEASGDILGAGLMQAIQDRHPEAVFVGIGGAEMRQAGLDSMFPMDRLSVMGLVEPLKRLPELLSIRQQLFKAYLADPPDVFVGIDSPEFNLGLELRLRNAGIPTVHYVSPSVWAWRRRRIHKIRKAVDLMLTLFPFEEAFYREHDVKVVCVGHPLADELPIDTDMQGARQHLNIPDNARVLAVLPGSRKGEVERLGPVFLDAIRLCLKRWPDMHILIPCATRDRRQQLETLIGQTPDSRIRLVDGESRTVMASANSILMASGTATLEGLLLKKPMVVAYKMAPVSYAIISRLLTTRYISLPNLLAGKLLVPELLQENVTAPALFHEVQRTLETAEDRAFGANPEGMESAVETFTAIHKSLRRDASATAAEAVLKLCRR
jgi:lipid-A-disaccharide synthase